MHVDEYKTLVNTISRAMDVEPPNRIVFHEDEHVDAYISLDSDKGTSIGITLGAMRLPRGQVRAIVAHELAHVKNDDLHKKMYLREDLIYLTIMSTVLVTFLYWQAFLVPFQLAQLYYYWRCRKIEYRADEVAAQYVGVKNVVGLLVTLAKQKTKSKRILDSFTWWAASHPTDSARIGALVKKDIL